MQYFEACFPHMIARRHNLRLDATVNRGSGRAERGDRVDVNPVNNVSVAKLGARPASVTRHRGADCKDIFCYSGANHRARRMCHLASIPGCKNEQILRVL